MSVSRRRRSIRLKGYDYARGGAYFVTMCTQGRACLFGDIVDDAMRLNDAGIMVENWWLELGRKFQSVQTDEYVVMPNHVHGIVLIDDVEAVPASVGGDLVGADLVGADLVGADLVGADLVGADLRVCPGTGAHVGAPLRVGAGAHAGASQPASLRRVALSEIVQWFKTMSTNAYIHGVREAAWPAFRGRIWQRNYYEHIVRDEDSLQRIRKYIKDNPLQWSLDRENPITRTEANASFDLAQSRPAWEGV